MNAVSVVENFDSDPENIITIEDLFHCNNLHQRFRKFLSQNWQAISSLRIEKDCNTHLMHLDIKTVRNVSRKISINLTDQTNGHEIKSVTSVNMEDSVSVLQVVLMFTSSQKYPHYTLELHNNSQLMLCCRKKIPSLIDDRDFTELITGLAHTADLLEETMYPFPVYQ